MNNIWFTSDTHFGHTNILKYEPEARKFKDVKEMNEALIHSWNSVVRDNDTVWHLGDFCFGRHNLHYAGRLKGRKRLVLGNHDTYDNSEYLLYFEKLYGCKYLDGMVLSHMPIHVNGLGSRWWVNVHGHLHSKKVMIPNHFDGKAYLEDRNYFNVAVEQNNLIPIHYDEIKKRIREVKNA